MELKEVKEQLMEWLGKCKFTSDYKEEKCIYIDQKKDRVYLKLYTNDHSYGITARPPKDGDKGYLGCVGSSRKPRAGEDWTRGNDLADGSFCYKTWIQIISDIVGYELVKIHRFLIHQYEPDVEE